MATLSVTTPLKKISLPLPEAINCLQILKEGMALMSPSPLHDRCWQTQACAPHGQLIEVAVSSRVNWPSHFLILKQQFGKS